MKILFQILNKITPLLVFLLLIYLISYKITPSDGIIYYGDAPFYWPKGNFNFLSTWQPSFMGTMWAQGMFGLITTNGLIVILSLLNLTDSWTSYLYHYIPVYLVSITIYYVIKQISRNVYYSYFSGFFVIINNFILEQFIIWPGQYFWSVLALILLFYISWVIYNNKWNAYTLISVIIFSLLINHPLMLFLYILYLTLFIVAYLYSYKSKFGLVYSFLSLAGVIMIHSFWIIPFLYSLTIQSASDIYNGNQLAVLNGYKSIAGYFSLFNFLNYPGFVQKGIHDYFQSIFNIFFLCLIVYLFIFYSRKKFALFLLFVYLIFFTFALGPNSYFTGNVWQWMFDNIAGFGFFRSFTRFYQASIIALIFLGAVLIRDNKTKYINTLIFIFFLLLIFSYRIYFTGNLDGTINANKIPNEYYELNNKYFINEVKNFSIISFPHVGYEEYYWSLNKRDDKFAQIHYFKLYFFNKPTTYNMHAVNLTEKYNKSGIYNFYTDFKFNNNIYESLTELNIKYVLIHKDLVDIDRGSKLVNADQYLNYFKKNEQFKLLESNKYFEFFEIKNYSPTIVGNNINYTYVNDTKYIVKVNSLSTQQKISFLQNYNKDWLLIVKKKKDHTKCSVIQIFNKYNTIECQPRKSLIQGDEFSFLHNNSKIIKRHSSSSKFGNYWYINPSNIKSTLGEDYYLKNEDGSIDLELVLFFKPQAYFYIGLIISITTLIFLVLFLFYFLLNKNKNDVHKYVK